MPGALHLQVAAVMFGGWEISVGSLWKGDSHKFTSIHDSSCIGGAFKHVLGSAFAIPLSHPPEQNGKLAEDPLHHRHVQQHGDHLLGCTLAVLIWKSCLRQVGRW